MVDAKAASDICRNLQREGIRYWLGGGWGIDALIGKHTRKHKDLDVIIQVCDIANMVVLMEQDGFAVTSLWSENQWVRDRNGKRVPTAFVLRDAQDREIDVHAINIDGGSIGIPAWMDTMKIRFSKKDLSGSGAIHGVAVTCISPLMQMRCHVGYVLPTEHQRDMVKLRDMFGIAEH